MHQLSIRSGNGYSYGFNVDIGQSNAHIVSRPVTYLRRLWGHASAFCVLEPGHHLIHTINAIPLFTSTPFIVTFEDYLPRMWPNGWVSERLRTALLDRLTDSQCRRLIAMSEYAVRQFREQNRHYPRVHELESKITVMYPSTPLRRNAPKMPGDKLRVLTVGVDFMRKGIPAVGRAHELLRRRGIPVETTIVSGLRWSADDYVGPSSDRIVEAERRRLEMDGLAVLGHVDNACVLSLMEEHDYLAFPTFHDTFGFVAIEALAGGTPVIASGTCALPEIIGDGEAGSLLSIENDDDIGKWVALEFRYKPHYEELYMAQLERFGVELAEQLERLWETRSDYERRSAAAIERVRTTFNRNTARSHLERLYDEA